MTLYTTPLLERDDPLPWLRIELPMWSTSQCDADPSCGFVAESPTREIDGIDIWGPTPEELVERVRAFERMLAIVSGRGGRLPVGSVLGGVDLTAATATVPAPLSVAPVPSPKLQVVKMQTVETPKPVPLDQFEQSRQQGYSGIPCTSCASLRTRYAGTCLCCENCGATSGCS